MPRFPKRLLVLGGLAAAGATFFKKRRAAQLPAPSPTPSPTPSSSAPTPPPAPPEAPPVAPPPAEAPGPSVTPPTGVPASTTEAQEQADATKPVVHTDAEFVAAEEAAAAREAAGIGGPRLDDAHGDEAFEAVYEAGGGEAEGFEAAEDALIENATHGDGRADPIGDAFTPEAESDDSTAVYGEPDQEPVTEVDEDETDHR
jgi:predicted lipid-binding transport protein (Tim44 family)